MYIQISSTYLPEFLNILLYVEANPVWMCLYSAVIFNSKLVYSALASQRKIRLADLWTVDNKLLTIVPGLSTLQFWHQKITRPWKTILSGFAGSLSFFLSLASRAISHARGHLRVSRFARRTAEKRETARSLVQIKSSPTSVDQIQSSKSRSNPVQPV